MKALHRLILKNILKCLSWLKQAGISKPKKTKILLSLMGALFIGTCFFILPAKEFYLKTDFLKNFGKAFFKKNKNSLVVLQINEQQWSAKDFAKALAFKVKALGIQDINNQTFMKELKKQLITDMALEYLLLKWAKAHFLFVSEKELDAALEKNRLLNQEAFLIFLKRKNLNLTEWKEKIKKSLLIKKATKKIREGAKPPSLKELKEYYSSHSTLFNQPARLLIYHVFHKKKELLMKIKSISKEKTLTKAVRELTGTPLKAEWVEKGVLKVFDQAFLLKKKEISPVWHSPYGWHLIQVIDKKPALRLSFEQAREEIMAKLMEQRKKALFTQWIDRQSQSLNILKNEAALKKIKLKVRFRQ